MGKPRKQTYTLDMYLNKIKDNDIRSDQDVQRMSGQWDKSMMNELVVTVLTDDYIPSIILGEELNSQLWIIDGLQRSSSLQLFRYGNYKITSTIEQSVIRYRAKAKDKNGNIKIDENGDIIWEDAEFDIKNKTYDDLPEELKKRFNEYQIETVIHEACDMKQISKFVRRYNNHTAMKPAQRAFTYIDNHARNIRSISEGRFFIDCVKFTEKERINGTLERVIMETVMCMFHFEHWKKQSKQIGAFLNEHASESEFEILSHDLHRLEKIISDDVRDIFTSKNLFIWLTLFHDFTALGLDDNKFAGFLTAFKEGYRTKEVNGMSFDIADKDRSTKDKSVIADKLNILKTLLHEYLHMDNKEDFYQADELAFCRENVSADITQEDIQFYNDIWEDLTLNVDNNSRLLDACNKISFIAIIGYACQKDMDLDGWFIDFFRRNQKYILNQKENYLQMKGDLESFFCSVDKKSA